MAEIAGVMSELGANNHDRKPVPDPTFLTQELVDRAIKALRELIESRLDGMDKAIKLLGEATDKFPGFVDMKIGHLRDLHGERFDSVKELMETQFTAYKTLSAQLDTGNKTAITAAFQANKEVADKQERTTTKEIDGLKMLIQSEKKSTDEKISATEVRVARIESIGVGRVTAEQTQNTDKSSIVAIISVVVSVAALIAAILIAVILKS